MQKDKEELGDSWRGKTVVGRVGGEGANKGSSQGYLSNKEVGLPSSEVTMLELFFSSFPFFFFSFFSNPWCYLTLNFCSETLAPGPQNEAVLGGGK